MLRTIILNILDTLLWIGRLVFITVIYTVLFFIAMTIAEFIIDSLVGRIFPTT